MAVITDINQLDLNKLYTYADYLTWSFQERVELLKGKIFKMSPAPSQIHQRVSFDIGLLLGNHLKNKPCHTFAAPFDVRLVNFKQSSSNNQVITVVQPDICVICNESKLDDKGCVGSPDLIVEILSSGNSKKEMNIKFDLYEENAVLEYWIVEPHQKSILIYTLQNGKYIGLKPFTEDEIIKSPLFPDLNFNIKDIFNF